MMRIGTYNCFDIVFERFLLDGGAMFGIIPKPLWERQISADEKNRIPMVTRCLLISGNQKNILVDTGIGDKLSDKLQDRYSVHPIVSQDEIKAALPAGFDISAADITDVVLTHLHFDHAGGATRYGRDKIPEPVFPNAVYHVQRAQWEFAHSPSLRDEGSYIAENYDCLKASGRLNLIDGPADNFFAGIDILVSHGHTIGQQHVLVSGLDSGSDKEGQASLFFASDLVPTAAHVPLVWHMAYDNQPLDLVSEKAEILGRAAAQDWVVCFPHDPVYAAARLKRDADGRIVIRERLERL